MTAGNMTVGVDVDAHWGDYVSKRGYERLAETQLIVKATDQNGAEFFCIRIQTSPHSEECVHNGHACGMTSDECDDRCCSGYWEHHCDIYHSRGHYTCRNVCEPFPSESKLATVGKQYPPKCHDEEGEKCRAFCCKWGEEGECLRDCGCPMHSCPKLDHSHNTSEASHVTQVVV